MYYVIMLGLQRQNNGTSPPPPLPQRRSTDVCLLLGQRIGPTIDQHRFNASCSLGPYSRTSYDIS